MEGAQHQFAVVVVEMAQLMPVTGDDQRVEQGDIDQGQCPADVFFLVHGHGCYRLRKKRTSRKLTGTQTQNIGMGAHRFGTPNQMNSASMAICSK